MTDKLDAKNYDAILSQQDINLDTLNYIVEKDTRANKVLLDEQKKIETIVKNETEKYERLEDEYKSEIMTRYREALLKKNNALITQKYNSIVIIITVAISLLILLSIFQKYFPDFSQTILILLRIAIISIAIIWGFIVYTEITSRDRMDYDKLYLERPKTSSSLEKKREEAAKKGDLLDSVAGLLCTGEDCCSAGTKWDEDKMLCVPITKEGEGEGEDNEATSEEFSLIKANEPTDNYAKL